MPFSCETRIGTNFRLRRSRHALVVDYWIRDRLDIGETFTGAMCGLAALAFELGLRDGSQRRRPRSSDSAMLALMEAGDRWPGVFQNSMRAVYLAGFRLAKAIRSLPASEFQLAEERGKRFIKSG
jgi:hypothetical protein